MKIDYLINLSMTVRETDKMFDKRRKQKYLRLATALNMWKSEFGVETVEEIINYPRWQYTWKRLPLCGKGSLNTFLELLSESEFFFKLYIERFNK